eukprot:scaffold613_cov243-Pinguiococcus_pyrenoidosus.AAC.3
MKICLSCFCSVSASSRTRRRSAGSLCLKRRTFSDSVRDIRTPITMLLCTSSSKTTTSCCRGKLLSRLKLRS